MKYAVTLLLTCLMLLCIPQALAAEGTETVLLEIGVVTAFPSSWTVVTPSNAAEHAALLEAAGLAWEKEALLAEGVYAVAFAPDSDATLRVTAREGDETQALYYDIERYTAQMRTAIKNDFLDKAAWALTGYRYSEAEWTNREGQGRLLNLTYTIRHAEETVARGRQVYTIRNGLAFTLDLQVGARQITTEEGRIFTNFVNATTFPESLDMPLLPVGLTVTDTVPEETNKAAFTLRGQTMGGASVSAYAQASSGDPALVGEAAASSSGAYKLDITLPAEGEYRLYLVASLEGYADSEAGYWISYDTARLPVSFTSYPDGLVTDEKIVVSGKTLSGVSIQCMEGETNKTAKTGSDGVFSFTLDKAIVGERTVVLSMTKDGYQNRRFTLQFDRQWLMEDYAKYLSGQVQSLSYKNLSENAEKYAGRLVSYTGQVIEVSNYGDRWYVQLALTKTQDGAWTDHLIAISDGVEIPLAGGDTATLYVEVINDTYGFTEVTDDGEVINRNYPAVTLLAYQKKS